MPGTVRALGFILRFVSVGKECTQQLQRTLVLACIRAEEADFPRLLEEAERIIRKIEPDCVLVDAADDEEILAVGREAKGMMGRTPADVMLLSPVVDGAVTDEKLAAAVRDKMQVNVM